MVARAWMDDELFSGYRVSVLKNEFLRLVAQQCECT